jgi:aminoglycoside phosphotransferase (APT) family kinase protein
VDEALRGWLEGIVGPVQSVEDQSWPHRVTSIWRVVAGSEVVWVKRHTQPRKYAQEARAYDVVTPGLAAAGVRVPERIACDGDSTLVLTHLAGAPAPPDDLAVARQAGEALAALHGIAHEDLDPLPVGDALRSRLARWVEQAAGRVEPELVAECVAAFGDGPREAEGRCWCHRDYSPRNWVVDGGRLGLLDFEHSGPDWWLMDLVKLDEVCFEHRGVEEAFYAAYGRRPADGALERLLWMTELGTVVWGVTHGDPEYEGIGRRTLARLRARLRLR